ncbi:MAG: cobalt ABC transporter ATP-binding protein [Anaerolineaceae bacterium]|nr:cobalt ABC transporter ATP-binding protein [Anaerolineaceae bacterium]
MRICAENIHFTYPGNVKVLDNISVTLNPGEKVALIGANGSGKTTFARHLNGLLRPQSGTVWVGDWKTSEHSPAQLAQRVAYVFQNPDEQLFRQRVWDEVAFGPQNLGYSASQVENMVEQALSLMGLTNEANFNPRDLNYSGRKRVSLASALAMQTPVLIFDEPTASLDMKEKKQFSKVLKTLNLENKTTLIISHDMDFVVENVDRIILMYEGKMIHDTSTKHFFKDKELIENSGLVIPQLIRLSQELNHLDLALNVEQFIKERERIITTIKTE